MELPIEYQAQMHDLLQDEYDDYLKSFERPSYHGLRVNTNKISVKDFLKLTNFKLEPIPWSDDGFYYQSDDRLAKHPYYHAGLYYLQEPSAMLPAQVLPVRHGDMILDTCAAPGGKSTKLLSKLNHTGFLLSNDISSSRCQGLLKNLELWGSDNYWVCSEDINKLSDHFPETFDRILVDAPCSGEGMFRKDPSLIKSWQQKNSSYYAPIQKKILADAIKMLKPNGYLVYSTCTFSIKENEEVIKSVLNDDIKLVDIEKKDGMQPGIGLSECVRLYPHKINGEGHFVALLKKNGKDNEVKKSTLNKKPRLNQSFGSFMKLCSIDLDHGNLYQYKDKIIFDRSLIEKPASLRALRTGLLLGEMHKDRFEPSQALALALNEATFKNTLSLNIDDIRIIKYLKGETIDVKDIDQKTDGWILVCVDHQPLGFGKIKKGIIKNKYAKGYRWQ